MNEVFKSIGPSSAYEYTGERMSAGHSLETEVEHFHRYYLARQFATDRDVLDIASGEGYGSALLAQVARRVIGVDIDAGAVAHAKRVYETTTLSFREGSATAIPLEDASIDLIVTFETLEHFKNHDQFFHEARRVLRPGGRLIISTPDRDIYSAPDAPPNPFHVHELNRPEFSELISRHFVRHALFAQRVMIGSAMLRMDDPAMATKLIFDRRSAAEIERSSGLKRAPYLIAICGDDLPDPLPDSLFIETSDFNELSKDVPWLRQEIAERIAVQAQERAQYDEAMALAEAANAQTIADLNAHIGYEAALAAAALREQVINAIQWKGKLADSKEQVKRLRGLWPRAELQRLKLELQTAKTSLAQKTIALEAIESSTIWRLSLRLRRHEAKAARAKALLRRALRIWRLLRHGRARLALRRQRRRDIAFLARHPLFNQRWYRGRYLADRPHTDPVAYYVWVGAEAGHFPHPLFDTEWYTARQAGLGLQNPFAHYLATGMVLDADPHPLFDAKYYVAQAPEAAGRALAHYAGTPPGSALCPTPFFDRRGYAFDNPEAAASGLDPVSHYAWEGATQDRDPHGLFNAAWYREKYLAGDKTLNPLAHWLREGALAGLSPHPLFSSLGSNDAVLALQTTNAPPAVSIIIPAYGKALDVFRCLYAVARRSGNVDFEVILSDDKPEAPVSALFGEVEGLRIFANSANLGFLRNCNSAARHARAPYLLFLNSDTIVHENWLAPLLDLARRDPHIGMVGGKLLNEDGTVQEAGGAMPDDGWGRPYGAGENPERPEFNFVREVDVVIGASLLVSRIAWNAVGGFDDDFAPAYYEEFDLAFALRARGWRVMYQPASMVTHLDSQTYGKAKRDELSLRNHKKFCGKWARALGRQPGIHAPLFLTRERLWAAGTILMLEDRVPERDKNAGALAAAQYVELLVSLGLKVIYYPHDGQAPADYTQALQQLGVEVLHHPVVIQDWLHRNGNHLDYIWATRPDVSGHLMDQLRRDSGAAIFYLTHDLHHLREMRRYKLEGDPLALAEAKRLHEIELAIFKKTDCILTFSSEEARLIQESLPAAQIRILPLFFYDNATIPARDFSQRRKLLFVGGFNHLPNVDAALFLVREIMPLVWQTHPGTELVLVGADAPPQINALAGPGVQIAGHVPDLAKCYAQTRISINPLRFGAGVKGKIVASLAAGLPVVTTSVGNEGIQLQHGAEALIGDTAQDLAAHITTLLDDDASCAALASAGAAVIGRRFSRNAAQSIVSDLLGLAPPPRS